MNNLDRFLDKFRHIVPRNTLIKDHVVRSIETVTGMHIDKENISVRGKTVMLTVSPAKKNAIHEQQQAVLARLEQRLGRRAITMIR